MSNAIIDVVMMMYVLMLMNGDDNLSNQITLRKLLVKIIVAKENVRYLLVIIPDNLKVFKVSFNRLRIYHLKQIQLL